MRPLPFPTGTSFRIPTAWIVLVWMLSLTALALWAVHDDSGWDAAVYRNALHSLQAGHDPYADAIAVQQRFHRDLASHPNFPPPFSYVYAPISLPAVRAIGDLGAIWGRGLYWLAYAAGALAQLWAGLRAAEHRERRAFACIAPIAIFFPGLVVGDIIMSGNVGYVFYGLALATAAIGWSRGRWLWFYLAVLAVSCFKPQMLSLLAIPVFSARRQWLPASLAAAAGTALFLSQRVLVPQLYRHFLQAVELQFSYNRDFGASPAGLLGRVLIDRGLPYAPACYIFYLCYAIPLFCLLLLFSLRFLDGRFPQSQWIPVLLIGVILLNPRLMEYDLAPLALPMALVCWRQAANWRWKATATTLAGIVWLAANCAAAESWTVRKPVEGAVLILVFAAACWNLSRQGPDPVVQSLGAPAGA